MQPRRQEQFDQAALAAARAGAESWHPDGGVPFDMLVEEAQQDGEVTLSATANSTVVDELLVSYHACMEESTPASSREARRILGTLLTGYTYEGARKLFVDAGRDPPSEHRMKEGRFVQSLWGTGRDPLPAVKTPSHARTHASTYPAPTPPPPSHTYITHVHVHIHTPVRARKPDCE